MSTWWMMALVAQSSGAPLSLESAVVSALEKSPQVALARHGVDRARGGRLLTEGAFDWTVEGGLGRSHRYTPLAPDVAQRDDVWSARLGVSKRFGWGMEVTPSVELQAIDSLLVGGSSVAPRNVAVLNVRVAQPLLRGFGAAAVADRDAAFELQRAAMSDVQHVIAERVLAVTQAYWRYQSATQAVVVLIEAEKRAELLLKQTQQLVSADERPKADLGQVQANLADRMRARLLAEQALFDARAALGLEMGLGAAEAAALGAPGTAFPALADLDVAGLGARLPSEAVKARYDVMSAEARAASAQRRLDGAEDALLPDLSLALDLGYSGVVSGTDVGSFFASVAQNIPGPNLGVSLALRWPVSATEAEGAVLVAQAALADAQLARDDLERRIRSNLGVALTSAKSSAEAVRRSAEATQYHRTAVTNEEARVKSGLGTLIDVISSSDRLTGAVLAQLDDQQRYAAALARLAFEAGALGQPTPEGATVVIEALTTPPR